MQLTDSVSKLKGIGEVTQSKLADMGIATVGDLLEHYPCEYRDMRKITPLSALIEKTDAVIEVTVKRKSWAYRQGRSRSLFYVRASDDTGNISFAYFNQSYMFEQFVSGQSVRIYGRTERQSGGLCMINPKIVTEADEGRLVPVYRLSGGLRQRVIRGAVEQALSQSQITDDLPTEFERAFGILPVKKMMEYLHIPVDTEQKDAGARQAAIREMMRYELSLRSLRAKIARPLAFSEEILTEYLEKLPFEPTSSQLRAMREIALDMGKTKAMNRLLQGDVGSGKTCVAFFAAYLAMKNGAQTALMAPTEILAEQHYENAKSIFGKRCALLTGSVNASKRKEIFSGVKNGEISLIIGTHALIYADIEYPALGLVITDEQHRFGVAQRAVLENGAKAHMLVMSATPIPRTLSLIMFGEAGASVLDTLPKGRKEILTSIVRENKRADMYRWIAQQLKNGDQAFVVCPLIEPSDELDCASATEVFSQLKKLGFNAALLHGRMKAEEKAHIMEEFRAGRTDILVSTTVIEVGVDVKNANIMVIESAERFGLAQLHQIRGRVGRGDKQARCFLVSNADNARLKVFKECSDGFKIAQEDLKQRGAGEFLGLAQSGFSSIEFDEQTILQARRLIDELKKFDKDTYYALMQKVLEKNERMRENIVLN